MAQKCHCIVQGDYGKKWPLPITVAESGVFVHIWVSRSCSNGLEKLIEEIDELSVMTGGLNSLPPGFKVPKLTQNSVDKIEYSLQYITYRPKYHPSYIAQQ